MEDPRWLRLITIGLVLAALAVGYFLLSGRFSPKPANRTAAPVVSMTPPGGTSAPSVTGVLGQNNQAGSRSAGVVSVSPSPSPASAYNRIVSRTQTTQTQGTQTKGGQTLPKTGFPIELATVLSLSALISGWGLRRFPN